MTCHIYNPYAIWTRSDALVIISPNKPCSLSERVQQSQTTATLSQADKSTQ